MKSLFSDEFHHLQQSFVDMGKDVSRQIQMAIEAFITHDKSAAQSVISADQTTNHDSIDLERMALELMALKQPVANDFRAVITILKASSDLERMGDHATSISWETVRLTGHPQIPTVNTALKDMSQQVQNMLTETLAAFNTDDVVKARQAAKLDLQIDAAYVRIRHQLTAAAKQDASVIPTSESDLLVARLLERIGDHVVNLNEATIYQATGEMVELNLGKRQPGLVQDLLN
ncbi:phosphate signaling complex protein PhoU [Secundilactobacillus kimchicus]|uniref:phosphate signaling complex protein PhoU n=1 Tax=Secundilactobacillus kimchicus TaxID=528209 RepID=UPI0024A8C0FB|nr:phosphate signaling complex protein PhoU [Secundilactobacillus kimchicus]